MLVGSERKDWDLYFLDLAREVGRQSTCPLKHVGAILVKDRRILATGFNGPPKGIRHECMEKGECIYRKNLNTRDYSMCPALHAEMNAVIQCAYFGVETKDSVCYCEYFPCKMCTGVLINAGIKKIVYVKPPVDNAQILALDAGIEIIKIHTDGRKERITYLNLDEIVPTLEVRGDRT